MNEFAEKQHLPAVELEKLRQVIRTKVAGELMIKSTELERTLHLAGQNLSTSTVEKIKHILEETYHTDEYFLEELESILAPHWEELSSEDIERLLMESFETFDTEEKGSIVRESLIKDLSSLGEMPLDRKDFQMMFAMLAPSKTFDYPQFVKILCGIENPKKKRKNK